MLQTAVRRQPSDESQLIHLSASSLRLLWLATCITYLLFLRLLSALISTFVQLPLWIKAHTARIESRIVSLAASILRVVAGETNPTSSGQQHRGRPGRDESYSARSMPTGPADGIIAPRHSSLEFDGMSEASYRQLDTRWPTHRPQAPRPPYRRGFENLRPSVTVTPPQLAVVNRGATRTPLGYDGAASSPTIISPIPGLPIPSIPTFITRMPYISVSDSIYSSSSTGLLGRRRRVSTTSSGLGGTPQAKSEAYTDLLPPRPSVDCDSPCQSSEKLRVHKNAQDTPSTSDTTCPGRFPSSEELEYSSLAAVAQQFIQGSESVRKG
ncbi:uncharacterized protein TRUGW13939_08475 [Talaromyces rugulosus]|uniref:Uncharacterized protein n=1 Tax=Talaromyces rugulosus TaxID=121627 RepID=A0A7H8R552_TALRU|nr:uncharacterized protein TRUGW13939_08475 [Talaromyces rugulosus]QKX61327.1 hypothetical protein TRUGW13939_08475 [Talaromyces rugulosus]